MPQGLIAPPPDVAPTKQGGLLGGFFGPDGRDARQRLAIGLMGLTHNPNQQLMQMWGGEVEQRQQTKAEAEKVNKTAQYLRSLGTAQAMQAAAALENGVVDAQTAYKIATQEAAPTDPWAGTKEIGGKLYRMGPNGPELVIGPEQTGGLNPDQLSGLNTLRDDLNSELSNFNVVKQGYNNITTFYNDPNGVSDYALAVAFAKILDPGSVAREGEVAAVQGAGAKVPALGQALKNAITGEGQLTPETRYQIANLAAEIYMEQAKSAQSKIDFYRSTAKRGGLPEDLVYSGEGVDAGQKPAPITAPAVPPALGKTQEEWQAVWDAMTDKERKEFLGGGQ